jgi:hypothetical protein
VITACCGRLFFSENRAFEFIRQSFMLLASGTPTALPAWKMKHRPDRRHTITA